MSQSATGRVCSVDGCSKPHHARGMCNSHHARWRRTGSPLGIQIRLRCSADGCQRGALEGWCEDFQSVVFDHIRSLVQMTPPPADPLASPVKGECWVGAGRINDQGYYQLRIGGVLRSAHRTAMAGSGRLRAGLVLDHLCRNRACCNPDHLELVTPSENIRRGEGLAAINAVKTHCKNGHEFTPENTRWAAPRPPRTNPTRVCRECSKLDGARRYREFKQRGVA